MTDARIRILVHGNAVVPQFAGGGVVTSPGPLLQVNDVQYSDVLGLRQGLGVIFRGKENADNFFHVSIPSPSTYPIRFTDAFIDLDNPQSEPHFYGTRPAHIVRVSFQIVMEPGVKLQKIFTFDGSNLLFVNEFHEGNASVDIPRHAVTEGLGVSFQVNFSQEGNITFQAVSAEFIISPLP